MTEMKHPVAFAYNANALFEFYEEGRIDYSYDVNERDYIPQSVMHMGCMDWDFLNQLERLGFTVVYSEG